MLGFIGTGNMASAIIKGLVGSKTVSGDEICVFDIQTQKAAALHEEYGVKVLENPQAVALSCESVVLCVKPNVFSSLLPEIYQAVEENRPLIVSIAAGKSLEFIGSLLPEKTRIVRVMPNINAVVGAAVSAYCGNEKATQADLGFADRFCSAFGSAVKLPESQFSVFGVIGGCSPAFAYMFIDAMARAAVKHGMTKAQALEVCAAAVLGSAKMVLESGEHPWQLVDKVCSPGGTTVEGVLSLQKDGFETAVANAVDAAAAKDKKL